MMRISLLTGVSLLAFAPAALLAQSNSAAQSNPAQDTPAVVAAPAVTDTPAPAPASADLSAEPVASDQTASPIDTLVDEEKGDAVPPPPAPTGDAVTDRLNALDYKVKLLEARNKELEEQAEVNDSRLVSVETRSVQTAKNVTFGWGPSFSEPSGNFTFKPRGVIDLDYAGFNARRGGYDYNNGTLIRRGRFGFDGTAFKTFGYRIEAEYVGGTVNLLDAYLSYTGVKNFVFTVGQQKAPYGLEANTSDNFNEFLERGMANVAFGAVGAERRVGVTAAYVSDKLNGTIGLFGVGEAVGRNAVTPDEGYGVNARITFDPILDTGRVVHLGVSGYRATNFAANSVTVADRPNIRVDDGRIVSAAIAGTNPTVGAQTGAKYATFLGAEAAVVYGPFSVQGEYGRLSIDRFGTASTVKFDGFYGFASFFLTGESRVFKNGVVDRLKPIADFNPQKGNWGAFELAARYDQLDLTDHDFSPLDRKATSWTGALNWYLNGNVKVLFNYIRFKGENSPLVVAPVAVNGTTAKGEAFATRLHLDF